jgi:osmoprotectant transport system ATP-binding protein
MTSVPPTTASVAPPASAAAAAADTTPTLTLVGVAKTFGRKTAKAIAIPALGPLDLEVAPGETVALIGPSGCGKTTILRLALGLLATDSGTIRFRGTVLTPANARILRRQMGYVVQEGGLFPHLTAAENVDLMARHLGWTAARIAERRAELATLARLPADALGRYPLQLSGGQRQRVSLMRALMLDPTLLLLDEPLGAIDPLVRAELQEDLVRIFERLRKTVVLVTHDLAEAAFFAHRVVLLREGRVVQRGRVEDLMRAPAEPFVARFVAAQRRLAVDHAGNEAEHEAEHERRRSP